MRVIVAGGTGFIGSALVEELLGAGYEVVVLSRDKAKAEARFSDRVRGAAWDGRSAAGWGELADGAKGIVNLAGAPIDKWPWSRERKKRILDSRVDATRAVVEAVRSADRVPEVVVQGSAVGFYGPRGSERLTEDSPSGEGFLAHVCRQWESTAREVAELGVRLAIARTGIVLGPGGALEQIARPFRYFVGGRLGSGEQGVSWVHRADEVGAIRFLLEHDDAHGPFNLTAPEPVSNRQLAAALGKVLGRPAIVPAPAFAIRMALGQMGEELLLRGQYVYPEKIQQLGYVFQYDTLSKALEQIFK